ncbi:hypothetical protein B0H17DRAFT_1153993 [Mycena rosella]|uniref:Uncharacterized protein n=1 Tax=Mycena rosella TaxID=1033263 RepID=A0AAD7F7H8_MYCRO|nr:hypothetical protein B0H17DRAFT_1153993 [Mycena rosella]
MSGVFVIVDDHDPSLRYSTGWNPSPCVFIPSALLQLMMRAAENAFQFAGTMTGPGGLGSVGSTATYEFEGTSISVFGLTRADSTKPNMTLEFAIDGSFQKSATIQPHQFETYHLKFFESPTLADGHHTLEITISSINSTDVLLDYLIYEASQNATLEGSAQILVLNTSPQLTYSQGWSTGITGLRDGLIEQAISLNNSVEGAADLGATVALNFTGGGFEVRGMLVKEFPSAAAAYSLDGGPWLDVQMPTNGSSYFNAQSNFEFIGQTFSSMETHSLVITPLIPGALFLDFITVQSSTAFFPRKANVAPPPSLTTSTGASPHGLHAGAIAGICIAIAACIGLAALGVFLLRRRRRRHASTDQPSRSRSVSEAAASFGTTAWTRRSDMPNRSVTPFTVYRDDEPSGSTITRESQPPMADRSHQENVFLLADLAQLAANSPDPPDLYPRKHEEAAA